jgi:hypothetical protein
LNPKILFTTTSTGLILFYPSKILWIPLIFLAIELSHGSSTPYLKVVKITDFFIPLNGMPQQQLITKNKIWTRKII